MEKLAKNAYRAYIGIGAATMGVLALCVIFSVIMRYFFSITFMWMEELIKVMFSFTTFWGMGACMLGDENIIVDILYGKLEGMPKKVCTVISHIIVLLVNVLLLYYTIVWVARSGNYLSKGLLIPYYYIYAIMPIGIVICIVCTAVMIAQEIRRDPSEFKAM